MLSYRELARSSDQAGAALGSGRRVVAIESANTLETVVGYLGTLRAGHVALMVDSSLRPEVRESLYGRFRVSTVVAGPAAGGAGGVAPTIRDRRVAAVDPAAGLALLLSTSGSTGSPKLVRLSGRSVDANARSIASYLALGPDERPLASLPLQYSYGLSVLNSHLLAGATVVLTEEPVTARGFWSLFKEARATSLAGVPATWEILKQLRFARMDLPSLAYCTQAGGRLGVESVKYFAEWAAKAGKRFFVMYGQTEATARMSYVPPEHLLEKPGSIGVAIPGGELSLVDSGGKAIADADQVGEIVYRGENVMWGYAESAEDLARGDEAGGVLKTGDLAYRDADGYYFIVGRAKRFAKVFGNRINLDEVEALLNGHGIVNAVTQRDDRLLIGVETADPEKVLRLVCAELQVHQSAARVERVAVIPRNPAGKVLYPELERLVLGNSSGGNPGSPASV